MKTKTTEQFIKDSIAKHGDRYLYNDAIYKGCGKPLQITCRIHGNFLQKPKHHTSGSGCKICNLVTAEEILESFRLQHGDRYDYSLITKYSINVDIICEIHGIFTQNTQSHIDGRGCRKCGSIEARNKNKLTAEQIKEKCFDAHGDTYEYLEFGDDITSGDKIKIICKIHGVFEQVLRTHFSKKGCRKCGQIKMMEGVKKGVKHRKENNIITKSAMSLEEFLSRSMELHENKYDYSLITQYYNLDAYYDIICPLHGVFSQRGVNHLKKKGCATCGRKNSRIADSWLDSMNITVREVTPDGMNRAVDGFDPLTNTVYQFHGDYFHGNPKIFHPTEYNKLLKQYHGQLYQNTMNKDQEIRDLGYNLVVIWEKDYRLLSGIIRNNLKKIIP